MAWYTDFPLAAISSGKRISNIYLLAQFKIIRQHKYKLLDSFSFNHFQHLHFQHSFSHPQPHTSRIFIYSSFPAAPSLVLTQDLHLQQMRQGAATKRRGEATRRSMAKPANFPMTLAL